MSKKAQTLIQLLEECEKMGVRDFDNKIVENIAKRTGFRNFFDVTLIDSREKLPQSFIKKDYFIIHLGKGRHRLVQGIEKGYHVFDNIEDRISWSYKPSIINQ